MLTHTESLSRDWLRRNTATTVKPGVDHCLPAVHCCCATACIICVQILFRYALDYGHRRSHITSRAAIVPTPSPAHLHSQQLCLSQSYSLHFRLCVSPRDQEHPQIHSLRQLSKHALLPWMDNCRLRLLPTSSSRVMCDDTMSPLKKSNGTMLRRDGTTGWVCR